MSRECQTPSIRRVRADIILAKMQYISNRIDGSAKKNTHRNRYHTHSLTFTIPFVYIVQYSGIEIDDGHGMA